MWAFAKAGIDFLEATIMAFGDMITVYGIGNCDTCQAAKKWLDEQEILYRFHNYDTDGLDPGTLNAWISEHGWETLLNKRSKTWRELPDNMRRTVNPASAAALMLGHPKLIKRPVIDFGEHSLVGFNADIRQEIEEMRL